MTKKPAGISADGFEISLAVRSAESGQPLGQARELAGHGVLVKNALGDTTIHFGLCRSEGCAGGALVAGDEGSLDLLDEGADPADPGTVDLGATIVATDALGLGRKLRLTAF